jgi:hypothetical protein
MCRFIWAVWAILMLISACQKQSEERSLSKKITLPDTAFVELEFIMTLNRKVYQSTNYGDPPQIAVWIENAESGEIRTVWVTHCAGKRKWRGKVDCPVALPYWEHRHSLEIKTQQQTSVDVTTGATPRKGSFSVKTVVPRASLWHYYVEVNAAGDYNKYFPYWSADGMPDSEGNGQPSVIYQGLIRANENNIDTPELIGRTGQRQPVSSVIKDLHGIGNARELINTIKVIGKNYTGE